MCVYYEAQLQFLLETLQKCRMQVLLLRSEDIADPGTDLTMRRRFWDSRDSDAFFADYLLNAKANTIYRLSDSFLCHYLFLQLPRDGRLLFIGPYLTEELSHQELLEHTEHLGLLPQQFRRLETYYSSLPIVDGNHAIFAMLDTFGEVIWGNDHSFSVLDIDRELSGDKPPLITDHADTLEQDMATLESRYAYENAIIQAVSQGLTHKAELLFAGFPQAAFEQRLSDPIRNLKNYSIIMNTLLRKAAENGGVHPLYIDRTSTEFARRIEQLASPNDVRELMTDMFRAYCRLVKTHAIKQYSPPVQKVITTIDTDPAADLSLSTLAEKQDLNASYLSALFRRETGETVTAHITRKRLQLALHLLNTTHLQVQSIAQHCGIPDVNYFSKLFKKQFGKSPKQYRESTK